MDASCKIQRSIHNVRLTYKYVSRILGTYQNGGNFLCNLFAYIFQPIQHLRSYIQTLTAISVSGWTFLGKYRIYSRRIRKNNPSDFFYCADCVTMSVICICFIFRKGGFLPCPNHLTIFFAN